MQNVLLFDLGYHQDFLPLSFTRPVADLRIGILTIREKWEKRLQRSTATLTEAYLQEKFPSAIADDNLLINASILPDGALTEAILNLRTNASLYHHDTLLACRLDKTATETFTPSLAGIETERTEFNGDILQVRFPWDLFRLNGQAIEHDFQLLTNGRTSQDLSPTLQIIGDEKRVFAEEGVHAECAILNTTSGPIYLGKGSEIMEGSVVRGALALCEGSALKLSTKIYGPTTIGPHSKVGGEVNNSVIQGFSNKAHDGFLGNSVIGEWCNLGADTNNSNLKNNYAEVKMWNYGKQRFVGTGLQFCGLIMGDHSKCGINTMFNTGTVVGVSANIFGAGFPRNFIASYSWGGASGFTEYQFEKAMEVAELVMERRSLKLSDIDRRILRHIFDYTVKFRK